MHACFICLSLYLLVPPLIVYASISHSSNWSSNLSHDLTLVYCTRIFGTKSKDGNGRSNFHASATSCHSGAFQKMYVIIQEFTLETLNFHHDSIIFHPKHQQKMEETPIPMNQALPPPIFSACSAKCCMSKSFMTPLRHQTNAQTSRKQTCNELGRHERSLKKIDWNDQGSVVGRLMISIITMQSFRYFRPHKSSKGNKIMFQGCSKDRKHCKASSTNMFLDHWIGRTLYEAILSSRIIEVAVPNTGRDSTHFQLGSLVLAVAPSHWMIGASQTWQKVGINSLGWFYF